MLKEELIECAVAIIEELLDTGMDEDTYHSFMHNLEKDDGLCIDDLYTITEEELAKASSEILRETLLLCVKKVNEEKFKWAQYEADRNKMVIK